MLFQPIRSTRRIPKWALTNSIALFGNGTGKVGVNLGTTNSITKIVVRNINDAAGIGFDNFT
jgi:hypothetical protein